MSDATVRAKLVLDGSQVAAESQAAAGEVKKFGQTVQNDVENASKKVHEHGQAWQEAGNKVNESLKQIAELAGIAFSIDKLVEFVGAATEGAERINNLSQSLGISTQNLQAFQYIAGLSGISLDSVSTSLTRLERAQVEARDGMVQTQAAFAAIGVSVTNTNGQLKPADQLIVEVAKHLSTMQDGATKTAIMIQLMGRGAAEAIPFFNALGGEFEELKAHAEALGIVLSAKDQAALVEFKEKSNELGQEIKGLGNQFAIALLPVLNQVVDALQRAAQSGQVKAAFKDIADAAQFVVNNFDAIVEIVKTLVELKLTQWAYDGAEALTKLYAEAGKAEVSLLSLKGAGAAVAAAFIGWNIGTYLRENFLEARIAGLAFVEGVLIGWENIKKGAELLWAVFKNAAEQAFATVERLISGFESGIARIRSGAANVFGAVGADSFAAKLNQSADALRKNSAELDKAANSTLNLQQRVAAVNADYEKNTNEIRNNVADLMDYETQHQKTTDAVNKAKQGLQGLTEVEGQYLNTLSAGKPKRDDEVAAIKAIRDRAVELEKSGADLNTVQLESGALIAKVSRAYEDATRVQGVYNAQVAMSQKLEDQRTKDINAYLTELNNLNAKLEGPYAKAEDEYNNRIIKADELYNKLIKDHVSEGAALDMVTNLLEKAQAVRDDELKKLKEHHDLMAQANQDLQQQISLWQVSPDKLQVVQSAMKKYDELLKSHYDFYGTYYEDEQKLRDALQSQLPGWINVQSAINDVSEAQKKNQEINKQWVDDVTKGFDGVSSAIANLAESGFKKWDDFGKSLLSTTKQFIGEIIQQFLRLTVFNGIINSLFGLQGSQALPTGLGSGLLGTFFGGGSSAAGPGGGFGGILGSLGSGGGIVGSIANWLGGSSGGGISGISSITDPTTWISAGQKLYNGFAGAFGSDTGTALSDSTFGAPWDANLNYAGGGEFPFSPSYGVDQGSGIMEEVGPQTGGGISYLGVAGGAIAAYNEYNAAGGGAAGLAGAAAYGVGTYFAGAAASAALSGGVAAGMAAIPVVGWIALAAMLINTFTGGGLFGTAWKPTGVSSTELSVNAGGATVIDTVEESKKKALFGGRKWRDLNVAPSQQQTDAANQFFTSEQSAVDAFAQALGQKTGEVIAGTFTTKTDKSGKQTTTTSIGGQTYTGETMQDFANRIQAGSFAQVLTNMGINVNTFTASVQGDATKLLAAVNEVGGTALLAQQEMKKGFNLLGDGTLADIVNETIALNQNGEKLAATYGRLKQELETLNSSLDASQIATGKTGKQLLEFADAAAAAAGGVQALKTLIDTFNKDFYTAGQQTAQNISDLRKKVEGEGKAIGEDPNESPAKFLADYNAALPTMTADQLVAWKQFGVDLFDLNQQVTAAGDAYQKFIDQFSTGTLSKFEQAMIGISNTLVANIKQANDLAVANGKAGASAQDIGKIISSSVLQGVQALQQLQTEAEGLARGLFGARAPLPSDIQALFDLQAGAKQQQANKLVQSTQLLGDLGQISAITGQSLTSLASIFAIPIGQLAQNLGVNQNDLQKQFDQQVATAKAALATANNTQLTNEILADIWALDQGKPAPYSSIDLGSAATGTLTGTTAISGSKPGTAVGYAPPTQLQVSTGGTASTADVVVAVKNNTVVTQTTTAQHMRKLDDLINEMRQLRREIGAIPNRNIRLP